VIRSLVDTVFQELSAQHVVIPREDEVRDYLDQYPDLGDMLGPISVSARQEFGENAELALEVYGDPEIDDRYLSFYIRPSIYDLQIMTRIEKIRDQFRDSLADCSGWLLVTTDFIPPGYRNGV
jgi:hypothetical protein